MSEAAGIADSNGSDSAIRIVMQTVGDATHNLHSHLTYAAAGISAVGSYATSAGEQCKPRQM